MSQPFKAPVHDHASKVLAIGWCRIRFQIYPSGGYLMCQPVTQNTGNRPLISPSPPFTISDQSIKNRDIFPWNSITDYSRINFIGFCPTYGYGRYTPQGGYPMCQPITKNTGNRRLISPLPWKCEANPSRNKQVMTENKVWGVATSPPLRHDHVERNKRGVSFYGHLANLTGTNWFLFRGF